MVIGTIVNSAGLTLAKVVSASAAARFADPGLGASPTWHGFAIDRSGSPSPTPSALSATSGSRIDLHAMRQIGMGCPGRRPRFFDRTVTGSPMRPFHVGPHRVHLEQEGLEARIGHEIEFLLVDPLGERLLDSCGRSTALNLCSSTGFVRDVMAAMTAAGVNIEQFHPEYGINRYGYSWRRHHLWLQPTSLYWPGFSSAGPPPAPACG